MELIIFNKDNTKSYTLTITSGTPILWLCNQDHEGMEVNDHFFNYIFEKIDKYFKDKH